MGVAEYRRSLHTSDFGLARRRCLAATAWFRSTVEDLRLMKHPTKEALEAAAVAYFDAQAVKQDRQRGYAEDDLEIAAGYDIHLAQQAINQLDADLIRNEFSGLVYPAAISLTDNLGTKLEEFDDAHRLLVLQLAARSVRELSLLLIHRLTDPSGRYAPHDPLFDALRGATVLRSAPTPAGASVSISDACEAFKLRHAKKELGASSITELSRVLGWLADRHGHDTPLSDLTATDLKAFRDDLARIDTRLRGQKLPFDKRLTAAADHQIGYATYSRYWRGLRQFFKWAIDDQVIAIDPSAVAPPPRPKSTKRHSPESFTIDELKQLFSTPLYAGHKSVKQVKTPGTCLVRNGHWWSGVLLLHLGLRAGELAQLTPTDFVFDADIPHLTITDQGMVNGVKKTVKNQPSVRTLPIHPNLLALGLKEFVELRGKSGSGAQVFSVFRLGASRKSEGATRFWGDYLKMHGLWRKGRATHVWRHTTASVLRNSGATEAEIAATVGHTGGEVALGPSFAQTKAYGGSLALKRKLEIISKLDFEFDVVAALGGPYDPKRHRA